MKAIICWDVFLHLVENFRFHSSWQVVEWSCQHLYIGKSLKQLVVHLISLPPPPQFFSIGFGIISKLIGSMLEFNAKYDSFGSLIVNPTILFSCSNTYMLLYMTISDHLCDALGKQEYMTLQKNNQSLH